MQLIDDAWLDPEYIAPFAEKCFLLSGSAIFFTLSPITTLPVMILRFAASHLESKRFIHDTTLVEEKEVYDNTFTHMQWNICGIKGGYDIEEGGQMPIRDDLLPFEEHRISKIIEKILNEDPDVLCLNELFDINDAIYLVGALQNRYAHFVIQCGTRTLGINSGIFFATKFGIQNINFTSFPKEMSVGNTKYAEKGFLTLKTYDCNGPIAKLILTHLQHSGEPEHPTFKEEFTRKQQLYMVLQEIDPYTDENVVLSGDLNLDDVEFLKIDPLFYSLFKKTTDYATSINEENKTWLGDQWYIEYGNKESTFSLLQPSTTSNKRKISNGINLDHVLVKICSDKSLTPEINTILKSTGYNPKKLSRESLSDHMILFSTITLKKSDI